ncbi:MAG: SDR family oxidoreductase [Halobacteria archaeon]
MGRLDGQVAVVTGSGRGIGKATATLFVKEGARVVINDVDRDVAQEAVDEINTVRSESAAACVADITKPEEAQKLMDFAHQTFGRLNILVNNAGITRDALVQKMTDAQYNLVLNICIHGAFYCSKAASKYMLPEDPKKSFGSAGKIVNVSSLSGVLGNLGQMNYSSAKAAIIGLTKGLAREWGPHKINVNGVAYGVIDTRLTREKKEGSEIGLPKQMRDMMVMAYPWRRFATVYEAAGPILFLASRESDVVNGHIIYCAGAGMAT